MRYTDNLSKEDLKTEVKKPGSFLLFDVCNDYSMDKADNQHKELSRYRTFQEQIDPELIVTVYVEIETDEIHYCVGPDYLQGAFLY